MEINIIQNTIALLIGILIGKISTTIFMARKLKLLDNVIYKRNGIRPIKELMDDLNRK